jgi:hypothetical protein
MVWRHDITRDANEQSMAVSAETAYACQVVITWMSPGCHLLGACAQGSRRATGRVAAWRTDSVIAAHTRHTRALAERCSRGLRRNRQPLK